MRLKLLPLIVNVAKTWRLPLRSTFSPAPPSAHGTKTMTLNGIDSLICFAALAGTVKIASAATRNIIIAVFFIVSLIVEFLSEVFLSKPKGKSFQRMTRHNLASEWLNQFGGRSWRVKLPDVKPSDFPRLSNVRHRRTNTVNY